jgi:hypothetical protein
MTAKEKEGHPRVQELIPDIWSANRFTISAFFNITL